jgi:lipooligosaccharide transport system permease protein
MSEVPAIVRSPARRTLAVWRRHVMVWRKLLWPSLASNIANPILILFAFGFGLGAVIDRLSGVTYLAFVMPGMMAYSAMFSVSFESTVSAYARFQMQRTWDAVLATPVGLRELLMGELLWSVTKGMISATSVLIIGYLWGGVLSPGGAILALIVVLLGCFCFAACGLLATSFARSWELFNYFFTFWVTPMFVFSGVFFEIDRFPEAIQYLVWIFPMTHLIEIVRPLTIGGSLPAHQIIVHMVFLAAMTVLAFEWACRRFSKRLFD